MGKWLKVLALAAVALGVAATASGDSNTYNYQTQGGVNFNTRNGSVVDDNGIQKVVDADRPEDRSPLTNLLTSSVAANTLVSTNVIDASQYTSFQIHMSWTVGTTLADTSKCDSVAFLLIPFGRTTYLDSGQNFIMSQGRVVGALGDTTNAGVGRTIPGILVTPRKNPLVGSINPIGAAMRYERIVWADFGASTALLGPALPGLRVLEKNYQLVKSVSFPLGGSAYGGDVKEPFIGFYVYNLSKTIAATSVTIDVFPKVN